MSILETAVYGFNVLAITIIGAVIWMHYQAWKIAPRRLGILPLHVMMVSVAQIIFILLGSQAVLNHAENPLNWYTVAYFVGMAFTLIALVAVGEYQRRRRL